MALTQTTLSSAVGVSDTSIKVAASTGFAPGNIIRIDQESLKIAQYYVPATTALTIPVLRGQDGTVGAAHASGAFVMVELATDILTIAASTLVQWPTVRARVVSSISVTGAIPIPDVGSDRVVVLNGTTIIAGTLTNPRTDQDGDLLFIVSNGKAAHTVTFASGLGNLGGTADVLTFAADQGGAVQLMAAGGFWVNCGGMVAGAATLGGVGIA